MENNNKTTMNYVEQEKRVGHYLLQYFDLDAEEEIDEGEIYRRAKVVLDWYEDYLNNWDCECFEAENVLLFEIAEDRLYNDAAKYYNHNREEYHNWLDWYDNSKFAISEAWRNSIKA